MNGTNDIDEIHSHHAALYSKAVQLVKATLKASDKADETKDVRAARIAPVRSKIYSANLLNKMETSDAGTRSLFVKLYTKQFSLGIHGPRHTHFFETEPVPYEDSPDLLASLDRGSWKGCELFR